jgi:Ca2+/Na+ antiporter
MYDPYVKNQKMCIIITIIAMVLMCVVVIVILSVIKSNLTWTLVIGILSILIVLVVTYILSAQYNKKEKDWLVRREQDFKLRLHNTGFTEQSPYDFNTIVGKYGAYILLTFNSSNLSKLEKINQHQGHLNPQDENKQQSNGYPNDFNQENNFNGYNQDVSVNTNIGSINYEASSLQNNQSTFS